MAELDEWTNTQTGAASEAFSLVTAAGVLGWLIPLCRACYDPLFCTELIVRVVTYDNQGTGNSQVEGGMLNQTKTVITV